MCWTGPSNAAFNSWDLMSSIGPITAMSGFVAGAATPVYTSGGTLLLDTNDTPLTFTATVTPEPATFGAVLLGLAAPAAARRVRKRRPGPISL